jgi:GT2 family glycosyltransferase
MKLGLVIASHGRPEILQKVLMNAASQPRVPDDIVISAVNSADIPEITDTITNVRTVFGSPGLTSQRNRGISCLIDTMDVVVFIDDDFIVGDNYFLNLERIFGRDNSIIAVTGQVIADGANSPGFTFEEGLRMARQYMQRKTAPFIRSVRFDERLPLYGWQEDLDFSGALRGVGRIVSSNLIWGVHLGTKRGKGSEIRLGYSQIINPAYIVSKGNMPIAFALRIATKNFLANLVKSIHPESYVDRRGRLRGNLIGLFHLMTGRLTPEYVLKLN